MVTPACVKCGRAMVPYENGAIVQENTESDVPYKLWRADLYSCIQCGAEVIAGWASKPLAEGPSLAPLLAQLTEAGRIKAVFK